MQIATFLSGDSDKLRTEHTGAIVALDTSFSLLERQLDESFSRLDRQLDESYSRIDASLDRLDSGLRSLQSTAYTWGAIIIALLYADILASVFLWYT